jgi:hypothetical protein
MFFLMNINISATFRRFYRTLIYRYIYAHSNEFISPLNPIIQRYLIGEELNPCKTSFSDLGFIINVDII